MRFGSGPVLCFLLPDRPATPMHRLPPPVFRRLSILLLAFAPWAGSPRVLSADDAPSFLSEVRPILARHCFACHGADEEARQAELRLDQPPTEASAAIVPGDPQASELMVRVLTADPDLRMPPPDSGDELSSQEIAVLRRWIAEGAAWETHWAFVPPARPEIPAPADDGWSRTPIDRFVLARMRDEQLEPAPVADPYTLIRRVSLDLTGLPPTPAAADAFAADPSDDAWVAVVDDLLASPRFGEHWARMWLDLARFADTKGYEKDQPREIWRYRDWVIHALNEDLPFDQFTVQQIAGDLLPNATPDQILATAFHRNTLTNDEGGTDNEEFRTLAVKDRVDTTMQVWMGLTAGCAKCHSHKYDPISQREYYQLYACFNQTADADRPDDSPRLATPTPEQQARITELRERIAAAGNEETADALKQQLEDLRKQVPKTPVMRELPTDERRATHIHVRGNFLEPGDAVQASLPAAFAAETEGDVNRLTVARWLVSDRNPLTARVMVNRVWARLFGRGLVETEEDFGTQGMLPTHPRLLDWLAIEFRDTQGWSLKQLCRAIVLSSTYRQTAAVPAAVRSRDPRNLWLARGPRFRLPAEAVRDQALFAAGLLSDTIGGPSVMPPQPDGIWRTTYSTLKWQTPDNEDRYRRGLYTFLRRTSPYPAMITFDAGSREVCLIRRIRTNTPLQALVTLNDPVYVEAAAALAQRSADDSQPIASMFRHLLIRPPSDVERQRLNELRTDAEHRFGGDVAAARDLLRAANRQPPDDAADAVHLAALTTVASVLLNLDETLMKP